MSEIHNVFVAHRHEDDGLVSALKSLLEGRGVEVRDASITSDKPNQASSPDYIKRGILAPNIKWAGKVIVLITPDTKNHDWVDWEIEYAQKANKLVIGVWAHGHAECELPEPLEKSADAVVAWNADKIIRALNGEQISETSDGIPRGNQSVKRIDC
ncbi:MAG: TIR domain-containing protein [Acidimicrobiia bacterium]|nr:TIR domain-containing protein [Acidimicrobiia bacterium]MCY4435199.1 TIR domain-containing protein [bacterium]